MSSNVSKEILLHQQNVLVAVFTVTPISLWGQFYMCVCGGGGGINIHMTPLCRGILNLHV